MLNCLLNNQRKDHLPKFEVGYYLSLTTPE